MAERSKANRFLSKETLLSTIFCWFRQRVESSLKSTSLLRIISDSPGPIVCNRIPHWFRNWEICISLHGVKAWFFSPVGLTHRTHIQICEVFRRSVPSLTIVSAAHRAWMLSTAKDLSDIRPSRVLQPRIPTLVRSAGALLLLSIGSLGWSVPLLHSAWVCLEQSFCAGSLSQTCTVWSLGRCILLHC